MPPSYFPSSRATVVASRLLVVVECTLRIGAYVRIRYTPTNHVSGGWGARRSESDALLADGDGRGAS